MTTFYTQQFKDLQDSYTFDVKNDSITGNFILIGYRNSDKLQISIQLNEKSNTINVGELSLKYDVNMEHSILNVLDSVLELHDKFNNLKDID
jgi:hypothetical protein